MRISDKAVVLRSVRHKNSQHIVKLYTREHGLVTVMARTARSGNAGVRPSALMPLSLLNVEMVLRQNRDVQQLTEAASYFVGPSLGGSLSKLAIAQFLAEVFSRSLREQSA